MVEMFLHTGTLPHDRSDPYIFFSSYGIVSEKSIMRQTCIDAASLNIIQHLTSYLI